MKTRLILMLSLAAAVGAAGCGGSHPTSSSTSPSAVRVTRGAITARSATAVTVNGIQLSTSSAAVRSDGKPVSESSLAKGMVVTVHGRFDDRTGDATEIETEHAIEGQVDDKGVDFVDIDGQRVHVDDSTEFGASHPDGLASISVGAVIAVSGVADDHGGIRAGRIDDSPRQAGPLEGKDDLDLQGFVSNIVAGTSFELRITPDAADHYLVLVSGLTLPTGFKDGARVEVHSLTPPAAGAGTLLGTITASSVEIEEGLEAPDEQGEMEIEGIVTSGTADAFVIDGMTVVTDGSTIFNLGAKGDLVPGVKVEAEGKVDGAGVLHATKVSFRPGARIIAKLTGVTWDGTSGSATLLGVHVQLPSFANYEVTPAEGLFVEVRGNPDASGTGIVALRVMPFSPSGGNPDRVFVRAVVTAKSNANPAAPTFTVLGFGVTTAGAKFTQNDVTMTADAFFAAVEVGRTVIKVRAATAADVVGTAFAADALELEGNE